jgi:hypothetical protein
VIDANGHRISPPSFIRSISSLSQTVNLTMMDLAQFVADLGHEAGFVAGSAV